MGRQKDPKKTVQAILDATLTLVSEKGCEKLTFADVIERTGLSKGAIFHHVAGKNELFVLALKTLLEKTDERYRANLEKGVHSPEDLIRVFVETIDLLEDPTTPTNRILNFLISRNNEASVATALACFYETWVDYSRWWIDLGRDAGVIPATVDSRSIAEYLVVLNLGLRVRGGIQRSESSFGARDFLQLLVSQLKGGTK